MAGSVYKFPSVFDPEAFDKLDPSEFYIPEPGGRKQGMPVSCRLDYDTIAVIDALCGNPALPWQGNRSGFLRWAVYHGAKTMADKVKNAEVDEALSVMTVSMAQARLEYMTKRIDSYLTQVRTAIESCLSKAQYDRARRLVEKTEAAAEESSNEDLAQTTKRTCAGFRRLIAESVRRAKRQAAETQTEAARVDDLDQELRALGVRTLQEEEADLG